MDRLKRAFIVNYQPAASRNQSQGSSQTRPATAANQSPTSQSSTRGRTSTRDSVFRTSAYDDASTGKPPEIGEHAMRGNAPASPLIPKSGKSSKASITGLQRTSSAPAPSVPRSRSRKSTTQASVESVPPPLPGTARTTNEQAPKVKLNHLDPRFSPASFERVLGATGDGSKSPQSTPLQYQNLRVGSSASRYSEDVADRNMQANLANNGRFSPTNPDLLVGGSDDVNRVEDVISWTLGAPPKASVASHQRLGSIDRPRTIATEGIAGPSNTSSPTSKGKKRSPHTSAAYYLPQSPPLPAGAASLGYHSQSTSRDIGTDNSGQARPNSVEMAGEPVSVPFRASSKAKRNAATTPQAGLQNGLKPLYNQPIVASSSTTPPSLDGVVDLSNTEDTTIHKHVAPAVIHETVYPTVHHVTHQPITREIHNTTIHHRILPVHDVKVLPAKHFIPDPSKPGSFIEAPASSIPGRTTHPHWFVGETLSKLPATTPASTGPRQFTARTFAPGEGDARSYTAAEGHPVSETTWVHPPEASMGAKAAGETQPLYMDLEKLQLPNGEAV